MTHTIVFIVYALLLLVGGIIGFTKVGSKVSLIMGIFSAAVVSSGIYLITQGSLAGYWLIALMSFALIIMFTKRFVATKKFMPSGMLVVVSLVVLAFALKHLI